MAINENLQTIHAGEGVGKKEPSYAVGRTINWYSHYGEQYAAAALLQSCPTLCDPIDGSSPGSAVPGILQVRTLEWVAISFSSAWKWKVKVKSLSCVGPSATPWTGAYQAPLSMGFSMQEYWSGMPLPSPYHLSRSHIYLLKYNICFFWLTSLCIIDSQFIYLIDLDSNVFLFMAE